MPGAEVVLQGAQAQRQLAGPDGIAHFGDLWAGRYGVVATHPGHEPGTGELVVGWRAQIGLATRIPGIGALGDPVALAAGPSTVTAAERDARYGGYFAKFSQPWANGDNDAGRQWGSRIRKADDLTSADPIAELQRDFKTIGYTIAETVAQTPDGKFDGRLARICQRFHHRWFGSPVNKKTWPKFRDKLTFSKDTAVMVKAVLKAL